MGDLLDINSKDVIGLSLWILGILSGWIITHKYYKRQPKIEVLPRSKMIISPKFTKSVLPQGIRLMHNKTSLSALYRTIIYIRNSGKKDVKREQVAPEDPIRIEFKKDPKLIGEPLFLYKKKANNFELKKNGQSISYLISFDFLDSGDGAIIETYHQSELIPKLKGTLIGVKSGLKLLDPEKYYLKRKSERNYKELLSTVISGLGSLLGIIASLQSITIFIKDYDFLFLLLGLIILIAVIYTLFSLIKSLKNRKPKDFEDFII